MNKEIIRNILYFYLDKEKEESGDYKYVKYRRETEYLTDFDEICNNNIIILKTKLNETDSKTVFYLFKYLFENNKYELAFYFDLVDDYLIPEILKKENIIDDYDTNLYDIKEKFGIDVYDFKYINEWANYFTQIFEEDYTIEVIKNNEIPSVRLYYDEFNLAFLNDLNVALQNSQTIITIKEIIELSG
jgi:hypothetical protein